MHPTVYNACPTQFMAPIIYLTLILLLEKTDAAQSTVHYPDYGPASSDDLISSPNNNNPPDEGMNNYAKSDVRVKRSLPKNPATGLVSMLFARNGVMENSVNLKTADFVIRLQEKYEHSLCKDMLESVPSVSSSYFLYDHTLVEPEEGDAVYVKQKRDKITQTFPNRYRMYDEVCDPTKEWEFWHEMFQISQDDHVQVRRNTIPSMAQAQQVVIPSGIMSQGSPNDYVHLQYTHTHLMSAWNQVWANFQTKGVCNQKLLLECLPEEKRDEELGYVPVKNSRVFKCLCRRHGVGLPTVIEMKEFVPGVPSIPSEYYTTQYYYDDIALVNGKQVRSFGSYRHRLGCVVRASAPVVGVEIQFTNPCDLFLPMIGMCMANCVENSSCASVSLQEKTEVKDRAVKKLDRRVVDLRLRETYHNKCVCQKGKTCQKVTTLRMNAALAVVSGWPTLAFCSSLLFRFFW